MPQQYEFPFASGISGTSYYYKNELGQVSIYVNCKKDNGNLFDEDFIGTIPEDFRPKVVTTISGVASDGSHRIAVIFFIYPDSGYVKIITDRTSNLLLNWATFSIVYPAQ